MQKPLQIIVWLSKKMAAPRGRAHMPKNSEILRFIKPIQKLVAAKNLDEFDRFQSQSGQRSLYRTSALLVNFPEKSPGIIYTLED